MWWWIFSLVKTWGRWFSVSDTGSSEEKIRGLPTGVEPVTTCLLVQIAQRTVRTPTGRFDTHLFIPRAWLKERRYSPKTRFLFTRLLYLNEQNFCVISLLELFYRNDRFPSGLVTRCSKFRLPLGVTQIFPSEPHVSLTEKSFFVYWNFLFEPGFLTV